MRRLPRPGFAYRQCGDRDIGRIRRGEFGFGHVQPAAVFWRVMPFEPLNQPARLGGRKGLIERRRLVDVEIVLHKRDLLRLPKVRVGQILEDLGVVDGGMAIGDLDIPPALQRGEHHEQIGGSVPFILVVAPGWLSGFRRDWHARFGDQLLRGLVQADQRILRIVRSLINLQRILHAGYEGGVGFGWNDPLLL